MPRWRGGPHTKYELKVHVVWSPKYRKAVLVGPVALRMRDLVREIAVEREGEIISWKVVCDRVHLPIAQCLHQGISEIVQWLKGISSRMLFEVFPH